MQRSFGAFWFASLFLAITAIAGSLSSSAPVEAQQLGDQPIFVPGSSPTFDGPEVLRLPAVRARKDKTRGSLEVVRFPDIGRELASSDPAMVMANAPSYAPRREQFVPAAWLRGTQPGPEAAPPRGDQFPRSADDRFAAPGATRNVAGAGTRPFEPGGAPRPPNPKRTAEGAPWRSFSR